MTSRIILVACLCLVISACARSADYGWLAQYHAADRLERRIAVPRGYERAPGADGSFAAWLRGLPLKPGKPPVYLYNGKPKSNQDAHCAVVNIDTGATDLQQCADAVMRLRAEYLYSRKRYAEIHFNFTSGDRADFAKWAQGYRPAIRGNRVRWGKTARADASRASFRKYLDTVFSYAGSASLEKELTRVPKVSDMRIGDVLIEGGFPGHAVIVVDMAKNRETGKKLFLLAQSYLPAQDIHLLKNPDGASPWYPLDFGATLYTPEWTFTNKHLRRFPGG